MPPVGFEPTISAVERLQTYALDRAATGTGKFIIIIIIIYIQTLRHHDKRNPKNLGVYRGANTCRVSDAQRSL